jgi:Flp pilus assembly protein TadB
MIGILTLGVMAMIVLIGAFFASLNRQPQITLEERIFRRKTTTDLKEENTDKQGVINNLKIKLMQSGVGISVPVYFMIGLVSALGVYILILFLIDTPIFAIAGALIVGFIIPNKVLLFLIARNKCQFDTAFIKALKRMSATMRTGSTLLQALQEVVDAEVLPMVVRKELGIVLVDYEYGDSFAEAFYHMYERTGLVDVKSVAMSIEIGMKQGSKLYESFDNYVSTIMERKENEAEGRAIMAESKNTTNILVAVPFAFNAVIKYLQPTYFDNAYEYAGGYGRYLFLLIYGLVIYGYIYVYKKCDIRI